MRIDTVLNEDEDTERSTSPSTASSSWSPPPRPSPPQTSHNRRHRRRATSKSGKPKGPCRPYSNEKQIAIWYLRKDMAYDWDVVAAEYNRLFEDQRSLGALRCRFYRVLEKWGLEKVRDQFHSRTGRNGLSESENYTAAYGVTVGHVIRRVIIANSHRNARTASSRGCGQSINCVLSAVAKVLVCSLLSRISVPRRTEPDCEQMMHICI
jgi:hypothetical protein